MPLEFVTTHELREGDVVYDDGMVLLIDQPIVDSDQDNYAPPVRWTSALITNWDEITDPFIRRHAGSDMWDKDLREWRWVETRRWTIQGNGNARWSREVRP